MKRPPNVEVFFFCTLHHFGAPPLESTTPECSTRHVIQSNGIVAHHSECLRCDRNALQLPSAKR